MNNSPFNAWKKKIKARKEFEADRILEYQKLKDWENEVEKNKRKLQVRVHVNRWNHKKNRTIYRQKKE